MSTKNWELRHQNGSGGAPAGCGLVGFAG